MARSNADLLAIKAELNNNPLGLTGYGALSNPANDEPNANALNLVRAECPVDRTAVSVSELKFDRDEFNAASAADREWIQVITQSGSIDPRTGSTVREGLLAIFGEGTVTRANIQAILTQAASRANQLFKLGVLSVGGTITPSDIAGARNAS